MHINTQPDTSAGTVTSVGLALDTGLYTVSGSPVVGAGTLTGTLNTQTANTCYAGPSTGAAAKPTFRALVAADIPALPYSPSALANTHIFVGNAGNVATDVAMSGGATISNAGVVTLGLPAVATRGGVFSLAAVAGNFITAISSVDGSITQATIISGDLTTALTTPPAIGGTTPAAGAFTTLSSTGNLTPSQTNGIVGTTTNNNVNAGSVGEYISSTILVGSNVPLNSANSADVTSISLTAGDWDVWGTSALNPGAGTTSTLNAGWISTVSATLPTVPNNGAYFQDGSTHPASSTYVYPIGYTRISLAGTTTIYLSAYSVFGVSTMGAYGFIGARRIR